MVPISQEAFDLPGERKSPHDKVFEGLKYSAWVQRYKMFINKYLIANSVTKLSLYYLAIEIQLNDFHDRNNIWCLKH
jgi:hypothetical protein